jgi:hypothetical protein
LQTRSCGGGGFFVRKMAAFAISIIEGENRKGGQENLKNSHVCRGIGRKVVASQVKRPK